VLLLNLPPDRRGLIHEQDAKSLKQWKGLVDQTFAVNLLKGTAVQGTDGKGSRALADNQYKTYWIAGRGDTSAVLEFALERTMEFDVLMLQENITVGQRIERFVLEYQSAGEWKKAAEGTTVGYKRLIRFDPVRAQKVRLRILSSRMEPTLSEIGLYKQRLLRHKERYPG
jgi:alpha-L-fucosidase